MPQPSPLSPTCQPNTSSLLTGRQAQRKRSLKLSNSSSTSANSRLDVRTYRSLAAIREALAITPKSQSLNSGPRNRPLTPETLNRQQKLKPLMKTRRSRHQSLLPQRRDSSTRCARTGERKARVAMGTGAYSRTGMTRSLERAVP